MAERASTITCSRLTTLKTVIQRTLISNSGLRFRTYQTSLWRRSSQLASFLPLTCAQPVIPGRTVAQTRSSRVADTSAPKVPTLAPDAPLPPSTPAFSPLGPDLVGRVVRRELPKCSALDFRWQPSRTAGGPEPLRLPVRERSDHEANVTRHVMGVKMPERSGSHSGRTIESDARDLSTTESDARGSWSQMPGCFVCLQICLDRQCPDATSDRQSAGGALSWDNGPCPAPRSARRQGMDDASRRSHH